MDRNEIYQHVNKLYVDMQINETLPLEVYEIYIRPDFTTASWRFQNNKHQIVIGDGIFLGMIDKVDTSEKEKYLSSFLYHELAHSLWTTKDLDMIVEILKTESFSFQVFNLFEDARIEEKMRAHTKKPFNWLKYELQAEINTPIDMFFAIVQCENKKTDLIDIKNSIAHDKQDKFKTVYKFYIEILKCTSSLQLISIIKNWYEIFPDTPKDLDLVKGNTYLFYEESETLGNNEKFDELIEGLDNILANYTYDQKKKDIKHSNIKTLKKDTQSSSLLYSEPISVPYDVRQRDMLLSKMEKMFLEPIRNQATEIPSKRLHVKRLASGDTKRFKRKSIHNTHKKKITIILDLSSSMHDVISNMRLLIDVLDKMAHKNIIEATLILSAVYMHKEIFQVLSMPLEKNTIEKIVPRYGGEGLHNSMSKNINLLSQSDFVWILTDGIINDKALDKQYYHKNNIRTHAMYIGDTGYKETMQQSFDYVICEKDVNDLAKVIFTLIK